MKEENGKRLARIVVPLAVAVCIVYAVAYLVKFYKHII